MSDAEGDDLPSSYSSGHHTDLPHRRRSSLPPRPALDDANLETYGRLADLGLRINWEQQLRAQAMLAARNAPPGSTVPSSDDPRPRAVRQGMPLSETGRSIRNALAAAAIASGWPAPRKPITTVVGAMPRTVYDETKEANGTERTLEYVMVQRKLLEYLGRHAADTLSARQACEWTQLISPDCMPSAEEALRLCYYMRSQGFDTYARVRDGYVNLYVASKEQAGTTGPYADMWYWKQNIRTNEINNGTFPTQMPVCINEIRRNAIVPSQPGVDTLLADSLAAGRGTHLRAEDGNATNRNAVNSHPRENLAILTAAAEATLQQQLLSGTPDPAAVEAILIQLEEYRNLGLGG